MRWMIILFFCLMAGAVYGDEQRAGDNPVYFITDELSIPMRSGPTEAYRIIAWPKAGERLDLIAVSEDGRWAHIRLSTSGKSGWVRRQYVVSEPVARIQLASLREKAAKLEATIAQLRQENDALKRRLEKAVTQYAAYQTELERVKTELELAEQKVTRLSDVQYNDLFLKGAGVALASVLIGVLLGRRRRRSTWA